MICITNNMDNYTQKSDTLPKPQTIQSAAVSTPWLCLFALRHDLMSRRIGDDLVSPVSFSMIESAVTKVETFQVRMQPGKCPNSNVSQEFVGKIGFKKNMCKTRVVVAFGVWVWQLKAHNGSGCWHYPVP